MNIKVEGHITSVARYIDDCTDGYADGQVERAAEKAANVSRALGDLCDVLMRKNLLTLAELKEISGGWRRIEPAD